MGRPTPLCFSRFSYETKTAVQVELLRSTRERETYTIFRRRRPPTLHLVSVRLRSAVCRTLGNGRIILAAVLILVAGYGLGFAQAHVA